MSKKYIILTDGDENNLQERITASLGEGWTCQGGVSVTTYVLQGEVIEYFAQAIIKDHFDHHQHCGTKYRGCAPYCLYHIKPRIERNCISELETVAIALIGIGLHKENIIDIAGTVLKSLVKSGYFNISSEIIDAEIKHIKKTGYMT